MNATLGRTLRQMIERGLRPYGYRLINPNHGYGIDFIADIKRLAKAYGIDVTTAFDVGANIGKTSLAFRSAWPRATIHAFEPSVAAASTLRGTALAQPFHVEQIALSDREGSAPFYVHEDAPDLNSLLAQTPFTERFERQGETATVQVATLDGFCTARRIDHINVLKIDTEGSDHDVLRGASRMLEAAKIDFVYCEFNTLSGEVGALRPIADLLAGHGYHFVAAYNDYITTEGRFFSVSNALFVVSPEARQSRNAAPIESHHR